MWNYVGIVRSEKRLNLVQEQLALVLKEVNQHYHDYLLTPDLIELRNIATIAELIVTSARTRKESRGLHFLVDYPEGKDKLWRKHIVLQKKQPPAFINFL